MINTPAMPALLTFSNLTIAHRRHPVVHHLSGTITQGSLTAIVGPNGGGKSSLLEAVAGRLTPSTGRIQWAGSKRPEVAYLPQQSLIDRSFPVRVRDVVQLGAWRWLGSFRSSTEKTTQQAHSALHTVGMDSLEDRLISELSVGQFQRVLFARLLMQDAQVILLDEPFNAMDERTCSELLALILQWHAQGRTVVAVLHDLAQVRTHFAQTLLLAREAVAWGPSAQVLTPINLTRARHIATHWTSNAPYCNRPAQHADIESPASVFSSLS